MAAYRIVQKEVLFFQVRKDFQKVVNHPCSRFWVSEERSLAVVSRWMKVGDRAFDGMRQSKMEMFREICIRVEKIMKEVDGILLQDAVFRVVNGPAPKFYMSPGYARNIVYRQIKHRSRNII